MNVEVPASEAVATVGRNLAFVREHAVLEIVDMERAWIFRLSLCRIVAARDDQHCLVGMSCPDLMEIDAGFELVRLLDLIADAAVAFDLVDGDIGGEVVGDEHMLAGMIHARMDRPLPQLD